MKPTESDIKIAESYVRERLAAELSMVANLETLMRDTAKRIVQICYRFGSSTLKFRFSNNPYLLAEVDAVIKRLKEQIEDYFITLAIADHTENKDELMAWLNSDLNGKTFSERIDEYTDNYQRELEILIGAGMISGISASSLISSLNTNLKHPYDNPLLRDEISETPSYGRGRTNSMFTALGNLTRYGIAGAWMQSQYISNKRDGAVAWLVRRGSSYPCSLCDSMTGIHIDDSQLPPYHGHCCCVAIPIYDNSK